MNRTSFGGYLDGFIVAVVEVDPTKVDALGSAYATFFSLPVNLILRPRRSVRGVPSDLIFTVLTGDLCVTLPKGEQVRIGAIEPVQLNHLIPGTIAGDVSTRQTILVPLAPRMLELIEQHRSCDVQMSLNLWLGLLAWGTPLSFPPSPAGAPPQLTDPSTLNARIHIEIPRAVWQENVLKHCGFEEVRILEIPFGRVSEIPMMRSSVAALEKAQKHFRQGDFDEAAAQCRVALEGYFEREDPSNPDNKKQVLKREWESTIGLAAYQWLNSTLRAIRSESNLPHHSPTAHFSRLDAQMLITVTAVVLAYLARRVRA